MDVEDSSDWHTLLRKWTIIAPLEYPSRFRFLCSTWRWRLVGVVCFISILGNATFLSHVYFRPPSPPRLDGLDLIHTWNRTSLVFGEPQLVNGFEKKPSGFPIVGLVFAGRRDRLAVLDCYLKRNLFSNGGFLDQVIFLQRTDIPEDIAFIHELVRSTPGYTMVNNEETQRGGYSRSWDLAEKGTLYIKIDDDIVFIEDSTIPSIVRAKLEHPEALLISANSMNQAALSWIHQHLGVVRPYLPELTRLSLPDPRPQYDWRASHLPSWEGPEDFEVPVGDFKPPFQGHRWLPARHLDNIDRTPIMTTQYGTGTTGVTSWAVGAQQHYSFLEHLENDELWRYRFHMWDYNYMRLSITFIAIWGDDIVPYRDKMPRDDEEFLTVTLPKKLKRHVIVAGGGLAVHFAFHTQKDMDSTDLLNRYKAYADENVCIR